MRFKSLCLQKTDHLLLFLSLATRPVLAGSGGSSSGSSGGVGIGRGNRSSKGGDDTKSLPYFPFRRALVPSNGEEGVGRVCLPLLVLVLDRIDVLEGPRL